MCKKIDNLVFYEPKRFSFTGAGRKLQHNTTIHCTLQHTYNILRTTHNAQHTTHNAQHTTHNAQRTTHNTQHTTHNAQYTTNPTSNTLSEKH